MIHKLILRSLVLFVLGSGAHAAARAEGPVDIVEAFHRQLLGILMQADQLDYAGRRTALTPAVESAFNTALITRVVIGRRWSQLDQPTRKRLMSAIRDMSIATYAYRLDSYGGETFKTLGQRDGPRGTMLVDTLIDSPGNEPVQLSYVLRQVDGRWWIIDVLVDSGISELAVRRSEYREIIASGGIEGLISALEKRIAALANG